MNWENSIESYKTYLILEKALSEKSVEAYLNDIRKFEQYCIEHHDSILPNDVNYEILKEYINHIGEIGISSRTQARTISSIRSFFKFLVFDGELQNNPTRLSETPKIGRKLPNILTVDEIDAMLATINIHTYEGQRNRAILEMLYSCGLRVSELINLKLSDINLRLGIVKVSGKGNKERYIPLSKHAKEEVKQYIQMNREFVEITKGSEDILFLSRRGSALSRVMVFNIIKDLAKRAGIQKNISPHTFRHSFASHLVSGGADLRAVQDMLGHESILTTEIYTHLDDHYLKDVINQFHPRSKKKKK